MIVRASCCRATSIMRPGRWKRRKRKSKSTICRSRTGFACRIFRRCFILRGSKECTSETATGAGDGVGVSLPMSLSLDTSWKHMMDVSSQIMSTRKRAHILIPQELVGEIDAIVGPGNARPFWWKRRERKSVGANCSSFWNRKIPPGKTRIILSLRKVPLHGYAGCGMKEKDARQLLNGMPDNGRCAPARRDDPPARYDDFDRCVASSTWSARTTGENNP